MLNGLAEGYGRQGEGLLPRAVFHLPGLGFLDSLAAQVERCCLVRSGLKVLSEVRNDGRRDITAWQEIWQNRCKLAPELGPKATDTADAGGKRREPALEKTPKALSKEYIFTGEVRRGVMWVYPSPDNHNPNSHFAFGKTWIWREFRSTSKEQEVMTREHFCIINARLRHLCN